MKLFAVLTHGRIAEMYIDCESATDRKRQLQGEIEIVEAPDTINNFIESYEALDFENLKGKELKTLAENYRVNQLSLFTNIFL